MSNSLIQAANAGGSLIQTIGQILNFLRNGRSYYKTTALTEVTKLTRVEPLTVVSKDCLTYENLTDVLQSLLSIFSGYYLQAVALSARVDNVKVARVLDSLNPDRDETGFFSPYASMETFREASTLFEGSYKFRLPRNYFPAVEDSAFDREKRMPDPVFEAEGDAIKTVSEVSNMAVGKLLNVEITAGQSSFKIPVSIRLSPAVIPNSSIMHILALKTEDNTLTERFHKWRAGRISFFKDLILAQDLIDTHKKALMNDENGVYSEIISRANNAKAYGVLSNNPSLVSASNLFVISETVARELEGKLGGKLSNARIRQKAFENTYAMIICVIDRDYERVTFYHRGIAAATDVSIKDIKASNKNKGPDIMDILKSYQMGTPASF